MTLLSLKFFKKDSVDDYHGVLVPLEQCTYRRDIPTATTEKIDGSLHDAKNTNAIDAEKADALRQDDSAGTLTIERLQDEVMSEMKAGGFDSAYDLKSIVINKAIEDVGMGRYNWGLFILCGFGWFADNLWLQQLALVLPSLTAEFGISENHVRYTTCYLFTGLCLGASFWGMGCDIMGRRLAFNATLLIAGVFGTAVGAASSWVGVCWLNLVIGFGIGGNLPVDGALFLEFLPNASGRLLTLLSVWWPVGNLIASLAGWGFMGGNYPIDKGWRYFLYTMGTMTFAMFLSRFLLFHLFESPKFLLSQGRQAEAVAVVHGLAFKNKTTTWLTEDILNKIGGNPDVKPIETLTVTQIVKRKLSSFSSTRIRPLFATKKLALNTIMLWFCWFTIGVGYPLFNGFLPQYLSNGETSSGEQVSSYETYRNYAITSIVGVPGSILACYTVDMRYIGRKGTMALSTLMCSIMLFLFTTSRAASSQLIFSALEAFFQNIMYGVLFAYTPEVFPAPTRGTGTGIASLLNRIGGLSAPIIAANIPVENPNIPILASGGLILAGFVAILFLSIETRGRQKL